MEQSSFAEFVTSLVGMIGKMIDGRRYNAPTVFTSVCAHLTPLLPIIARKPTQLSPELVRGHAKLGQADLPYYLISEAEKRADCPDLEETLLTSGFVNLGFYGKHIVVKRRYIVSFN